jgi:hypothetical protein
MTLRWWDGSDCKDVNFSTALYKSHLEILKDPGLSMKFHDNHLSLDQVQVVTPQNEQPKMCLTGYATQKLTDSTDCSASRATSLPMRCQQASAQRSESAPSLKAIAERERA